MNGSFFDVLATQWTRVRDPRLHWTERALIRLTWLGAILITLTPSVTMGAFWGDVLRSCRDALLQERLFLVNGSLVWLGQVFLTGLLTRELLYRDKVLPQLVLLPLTPRQLFLRKLPALGAIALAVSFLTALVYESFALSFVSAPLGKGVLLLVGVTLLLALLQSLLCLVLAVTITFFCFHQFHRFFFGVVILALFSPALFDFLTRHGGSDLARQAVLRWFEHTQLVHVVDLLPGAWILHVFSALYLSHAPWVPWVVATAFCLAFCTGLVWRRLPAVYNTERILHELARPTLLNHGRRSWGDEQERVRRPGAVLRTFPLENQIPTPPTLIPPAVTLTAPAPRTIAPGSLFDRLFQHLFTDRERTLLALLLTYDYTGELGLRTKRTVWCASLVWTAVATLRIPQRFIPVSVAVRLNTVLIVSFVSFMWLLDAWTRGIIQRRVGFGSSSQAVGPVFHWLPASPVKLWTVFVKFWSLGVFILWSVYLPAILLLPGDFASRCALAVGALLGFLGVGPLFLMILWLCSLRDARRTPRGALNVAWYWLGGVVAECAFVGVFVTRLGPLLSAVDAAGAVVAGAALVLSALLLFPVWYNIVRRRNYDVACL